MRTAIQHSHPRSGSAASFGRVARRTPVAAWPGADASRARDAGMQPPRALAAGLDAQRLRVAARAHSFATLGRLIAATVHGVRSRLDVWRDAARERALRHASHRALLELDARTLRDIGLNPGEPMPDREARPVRNRRQH